MRNLQTKIVNLTVSTSNFFKKKLRIIRGQLVIHVIGDSHSLLFQDPLFDVHYIGPATAFKLDSENSITQSNRKILKILSRLNTTKNNFFILVFGEIDARIHIFKAHKERNVALEKAIKNTAEKYVVYVKKLKTLFPNIDISLFNVLPPGTQGNVYHYKYYPSRKIRFYITKEMNKYLHNASKKNGFIFIDIFNKLIDKKNNRLKKYIFDDIHYNSEIVPIIKDYLRQINKVNL